MSHQNGPWWHIRCKFFAFSLCSTVPKNHLMRHPGYSRDEKRGVARWTQKWAWSWLGRSLCWEFHDQLCGALSGTTSEKISVPSRIEGERILEVLWRRQMPSIIGFGGAQPYSRGEFQESSESVAGVFPEFFRNFFRKVPAKFRVLWSDKSETRNFRNSLPFGSDRFRKPRHCV